MANKLDGPKSMSIMLSAREKSDYFEAIISSSDDAIIGKTVCGIVTSWNRGAELLFGYSAIEMIGRSMLPLIPEDRVDEESFILNLIVAGERVDHFATIRIHKNGTLLDVSETISPITDSTGKIIGASKIARDISERKQLEAIQSHFRAIVESSDAAIFSQSLDGIILSWNAGATAIFGFSEKDMIGQSVTSLLLPAFLDQDNRTIQALQAGEKQDCQETSLTCKNGTFVMVSMTTSPIRNDNDKVVGISRMARDVTAKKLSEARLLLTSSVFTGTTEGIVITNSQGRIVEVNDAFVRISGYEHHELLNQFPTMLRSSYDPDFIQTAQNTLASVGFFRAEAWIRRKDGSPCAGLLTINRIRDSSDCVTHYVALISDITALRLKQEQLEHMAHFDALTDLPNRVLLADRLTQSMAHVLRSRQSLAVLYLDLDYFKEVNDKHGHAIGDQLLVTVSQRMRAAMRSTDTLSRIGGDEFVAVLEDVGTLLKCRRRAERLLQACAEPVLVDGIMLQMSASIGMTIYPQDDVAPDQLIRHADQAMYEAKQSGRKRVALFDSVLEIEVNNRSHQLARLVQAFDSNEFALYFQPQVNMRLGCVIGAEALIRWLHPQRGVVPPAQFLGLIDNHWLEYAIGYWVIDTGLAQIAAWQKMGLNITVSVNVSANVLQHNDFVANLAVLIDKYPGLAANALELEILETSALNDITALIVTIQQCQQLGVCFAVDDFGTGYSSLTYLRRLPVETLKIDQSFVRDILIDHDDFSIVQGVIALAQAFHREVIAEGVENIEIGEQLLDLGCDLAQGYGIARPMPAEQFPDWVRSWTPHSRWKHHSGQ